MKNSFVSLPRRPRGFNMVELMIVVAIVAVLTLMAYNGYGAYVRKGEYAACVKKMKNFGSALQSYVTENQGWPDEDVLSDATGKPPDEDVLWDWWYEKMLKFGITHDDWFCPTDLRLKNLEKK